MARARLSCPASGALTVGELAAHERVQPPSMTRTVNCLRRAATSSRRPHETDGRQVVVELSEQGRTRVLADRDRRDAWLARRLRELTPDEREVLRRPSPSSSTSPRRTDPPPYEPHVPRPRATPTTAATPAGSVVSNTGTWMQRVAQDWLVLHVPGSQGGTSVGITTGLQFLPILLLSPYAGLIADRFPKRPLLQVTQLMMALPALLLGVLAVTGVRPGLARLRARVRLRHRHRLRRPGPAVVRVRDRRPRRPDQRRRPQLRVLQRRPHHRPGDRRPDDRRARRRRGRRPAG